jgi:hypothetical protein
MSSRFFLTAASALLIVLTTPTVRAADPIRFSELIFPLETLTALLWQPFTTEAGYARWIQQYGTHLPDGTAVLFNSQGIGARIMPESHLSADARRRVVRLKMVSPTGEPYFAFQFVTTGTQLAPYDRLKVAKGILPFWSPGPNPEKTDFSFSLGHTEALRVETTTSRSAGQGLIRARFFSDSLEFMTYSEAVTENSREITYSLFDQSGPKEAKTYSVRKVQVPGRWEGTETHRLNGVPVSLGAFNTAFRNDVLVLVAVQWPAVISIIGNMMTMISSKP